jgi:hypothetical protein
MSSALVATAKASGKASGKAPGVAALAAALACGWALLAAPPARHAIAAALAPAWEAAFPPAPTLTVGDVRARRLALNGQSVLFVEGVIHNGGAKGRKTPGLRLSLVGDDGRALYSWTAKAARPDLAPGDDVAFQTRLAAPPEKFKSITIAFDSP